MPIASHKPTVKPQIAKLPDVQPVDYRSTIVNDAITPTSTLLSFVQGAPWTVDYYAQVLGEHSSLKEIDPTIPDVYQAYTKINQLEIRVSTPLSPTYDQDSGISTFSGNGLIYPFLVPNSFDYFIADAGDVRKGLFRVITVERKSVNRDSVHYVEYELVGYVENKKDLCEALESRLTATYWFDKDRLIEKNTPLLREDTYHDLKDLVDYFKDISRYYYSTFYNKRFNTLVIPGQSRPVYDHYVVDFFMKIVDSSDVPDIVNIRAPIGDDDPIAFQPNIWSILLQRDYELLDDVRDTMSFVARGLFSRNPYLQGFFYSGMDFLAYPKSPDTSVVGTTYLVKPHTDIDIAIVPRVNRSMGDITNNEYRTAQKTYELSPILDLSNSYILSKAFYDKADSLSVLEILIKDYLKKQSLDKKMLVALCEKYKKWSRLEQFYFGPMLLVLIKAVKQEAY